jgi:transmembrane protein 222
MELEQGNEIEDSLTPTLWPLEPIDLKRLKFPCCLVWTPLPVVSWLVPYMGHIGICLEDGTVLDFFGSNLVNVGEFGYGAIARYLPLDRNKVLFFLYNLLVKDFWLDFSLIFLGMPDADHSISSIVL